jgi:hypothetical protein
VLPGGYTSGDASTGRVLVRHVIPGGPCGIDGALVGLVWWWVVEGGEVVQWGPVFTGREPLTELRSSRGVLGVAKACMHATHKCC